MTESEWKIFRQLREVALDRLCQRILSEAAALIADESKSHHARYGALYKLMKDRDRQVAQGFDGARRSIADIQLMYMRSLKLITDEELARFSPELRSRITL
jgi:hypothetical protein